MTTGTSTVLSRRWICQGLWPIASSFVSSSRTVSKTGRSSRLACRSSRRLKAMNLSSLTNLIPTLPSPTKILGVATAALTVSTGVLGFLLYHEIGLVQQCHDAVRAQAKVDKVVKTAISNTDTRNAQILQDTTSARIASAIHSLRTKDVNSSSGLSGPAAGSPSATSEDSTSELLPNHLTLTQEESDREICVVNTIIAEGWQKWYDISKETRKDILNVNPNAESGSLRSEPGGRVPGSLQGLEGGLDLGNGGDKRLRTRSIPEVQGQSLDDERGIAGRYVASGDALSTFGTSGFQGEVPLGKPASGSPQLSLEYGGDPTGGLGLRFQF